MTLGEAANRFLNAKKEAAESGTITDRTFREYQGSTSRFVAMVGRDFPLSSVGPDHFSRFKTQRSKSLNLIAIGNEVSRVRSLFRWLYGSDILKSPPRFGPDFKKPGERVLDDGGMYWRRRTFETVAGARGDQVAVDAIMGHVDNSMAAVYRQEVQKDRLIRASNTVREWLFEDNLPPSLKKPR